jgi:uncharacterized integral membrane protein
MKNKNNRIFKILFVAFILAVLLVLFDLARQTSAPWNKKKQIERAIPK